MEPPISQTPLAECDRHFRSVFSQAAIGVAIIDRNGFIVYVNEALCRMCGYEEQELCRMHFLATVHPDDRGLRLETFEKVAAGETGSYVHERRMIRKDGTVVWARTSVTVLCQLQRPHQVIVFVEDVTERKQTEDALRASEERFRIAAENASDLIYEWDLRSGTVSFFGSSEPRLGDWPMPTNHEDWKKLVHPGDLGRVISEIGASMQSGGRFQTDYRIVGKNGRIFYYFTRGQIICNGAGEPYKCIGVDTDITERRVAEEATSRLAAIVQCSDSAIFSTDLSGAITTWNEGAHKLIGYSAIEAQSLPLATLFDSAVLAQEILSRIEQGLPARMDDAVFLRADGNPVSVLLSVCPIRMPNGQITGAAVIGRDISARKQAERELAHRVLHDHLTGLPNRLFFADGLASSIAAADLDAFGTAVIFVDLDGFKFINDSLGHEAGDSLLQQVAERMTSCVRHGDLLARTGGDEFMLVVNGVTDEQVALGVAERLRAALRNPFFVAHHEIVTTASMGIAIYPRDGTDVSTLRRNADAAMYEAKQSGKDQFRFYRPAVGAAFQTRLEMETDLRHALDRGELCLYYQPMFTAADHRQTAYEALARWCHPGRGFVPPTQFIRLAEETGLIIRLGEWVLRDACLQCRWWQDHGKPLVRVAVNVSPLQFVRNDFVNTVLTVLRETGLSGALLDLELTESIVMHDIDGAVQKMAELREHGIRISVDDFGTGYSSLGYLPRLPIDTLKIDRCFVTSIDENQSAVRLIQGMISLAHSIGKRVIVEGVETSAQLEILRKLRCEEVQGFLLGRPARLTRDDELPQQQSSELLIA